jgi:aspartyl-tRNA(Asn)/glutamyl-tRNA(Gln) amidotransferase subunit B
MAKAAPETARVPAEVLARYEPVIGLEVHVQLLTKSKLFCACSTRFGDPPNSNVCPVCLGLPGTLPVVNRRALEMGVKAALAIHCTIQERSRFARKNYFYPDLPKGYQISMYEMPLATGGWLEIEHGGLRKRIGITRLHLEDDAAKNLHEGFAQSDEKSYVDYNRCGTPLAEIVSEPDLRSPAESYAYLTALKQVMLYTEVSDCNMEEGSLRCDANVSVRPRGQEKFGTKAEVKNVNSFRFVRAALEYEIERQIGVIEEGGRVVQESRLWNNAEGRTYSMRSKEQAHDYRYFPEPDLPPLAVDQDWIERARASLPELPESRYRRYTNTLGLSAQDAGVLTSEREIADYFDAASKACAAPAKRLANWIINEVLARVDDPRTLAAADLPVPPKALAELVDLVEKGTLSGKLGKDVFGRMWQEKRRAGEIVASESVAVVSDVGLIEGTCKKVVAAYPDEVARFRAGQSKLLGFFVGKVMKEMGGKADPKTANEILQRLLA